VSPHSHIQEAALLWIGALWIASTSRSIRPFWVTVVAGSTVFLLTIVSAVGAALLTPMLALLWLATARRCQQLVQREATASASKAQPPRRM
ncbi:MAG: hypothetical protein M8863_06190, partial [marine benthic group bacterium]|nr:hypothetical protein [Gemmatimonadota bacterium]